jgi:hypothetical protein
MAWFRRCFCCASLLLLFVDATEIGQCQTYLSDEDPFVEDPIVSSSLLQSRRQAGVDTKNEPEQDEGDDPTSSSMSSSSSAPPSEEEFLARMREEEEDRAENAKLAQNLPDEQEVEPPTQNSTNMSVSLSEWAWWQQTPGCHCDVHNRRRHERARLNHNDEHYYFIATNLHNRRRASIQGCHCEHESTLGPGWYCPARWWTGGLSFCSCRVNYRQVGSECIPECRYHLGKVVGKWRWLFRAIGTQGNTVERGTQSQRSDTTSESWSLTITEGFEMSSTVGFEIEGVGASTTLTVSASVGESWGRESSTTISMSQSQSTSVTWSTAGIDQRRHIWQWVLHSYNECNDLVGITYTDHRDDTASQDYPPCCMPRGFIEGSAACVVGKAMYSASTIPPHCHVEQSCHDEVHWCSAFVPHFCTGTYSTWMAQNCALSCNLCSR